MTAPRPPRAPLPDWSEGLREGTESLSIRPEDGLPRPLAMGTSEGDTSDVLALPPLPAGASAGIINDDGPTAAEGMPLPDPAEDRTKVDVRLMRPRPPKVPTQSGARASTLLAEDDGQSLIGSTLGSYRLLARIGKGGMGHVYRAEHVRLGREVALKLLRQDYAVRKDAVARFFQEARTVNRVRHRNIVDVTDFLELEDGTTFIIMELLTGQSLGSWVRTGIEVTRALGVLAQICEGLAAAHSVNVIHRDLKPDNVIITREPDGSELVKLLDFGVAKLINQSDDDFGVETAAGSVVGTPAYMSPEQAGGLPIDGRSDIYSLGAIMYELFCGQPMFRGRSFGEFVRKHLTEQPVPPRATPRGERLDPRIEAIILRAIEKEPSRRYQAVTELRDALIGLLTELAALNQSGQRRIAPLPGESGRMPAMFASPPATMLPSHPGGPASPSADQAPLVDITMESEELSRPDLASARARETSRARPRPSIRSTGQRQYPPRATPWYVWFIGGALAVGLGIGGATWYARSLDPKRVAAAAPVSPAAATLIEIRLTSQPGGAGVFKEGTSTELCRTPCLLNLDPADLGGISVRPFVLRRDGFADQQLVVDLHQPQREFDIALVPSGAPAGELAGATPEVPTPDDATARPDDATAKPDDATARPDDATAKPDDGKPADRRRPTRPRKGSGAAKADEDDASFELPAEAPDKPEPSPDKPSTDPGAKPAADPGAKPANKSGKIDTTETIDPFRARP